jgi:ribosomal protein L4
LIVPKIEKSLRQPSKNLKTIKILQANSLNFKELLLTKSILLTKDSLKIIEETYKNA